MNGNNLEAVARRRLFAQSYDIHVHRAAAHKDAVHPHGLAGTKDRPQIPRVLHPIQQAFIDAGAVQCGFCTPGMIMSAKALLDQNPDPDEEAIRRALSANLCRCTGYAKIEKAIMMAADVIVKYAERVEG